MLRELDRDAPRKCHEIGLPSLMNDALASSAYDLRMMESLPSCSHHAHNTINVTSLVSESACHTTYNTWTGGSPICNSSSGVCLDTSSEHKPLIPS